MKLDTLFDPRSVAIIGADDNPTRVGYALMKNVLAGEARDVYPVTLDKETVLGKQAYQSVLDIPGSIDVALIAVRASIVSSVLMQCVEKGIRHVVLISAGFKEAGGEGIAFEAEVTRLAREHNITLLGPNCLGIMNTHTGWNASFAVEAPKKGTIAFVSQSGALGTALLDWANREGVGFSKFVSLGNEASLNELDFMDYLADDPETNAVLLYLEKVSDGARFIEYARRISARKPLVVLRAGRSVRGSMAVASHTGSLAPADAIFETAIRQAGAIPIESLDTFYALTKLFQLGITTPLTRLVVLTNGGGPSVHASDRIDFSNSLTLTTFDEATRNALAQALPPMAATQNPIDVIGDAGPERYNACLKILTKLKEVDAILALVTPQMMTDPKGIAKVFIQHNKKKPIIPIMMGGASLGKGVAWLHKHRMVRFDTPTGAIDALDALAKGASKQAQVHTTTAKTHLTPLTMMPMGEMQQLLSDYSIPLQGIFVEQKENLASAVRTLGDGPYVLKVFSPQVVHKSDMKGVRLGLTNTEEVLRAWEEMETHIQENVRDAVIHGMTLQKMTHGVECIIGMKRDAIFGPVIVFGLGGVFVEILKDARMRIAPVSKDDALQQIREIQGLPILLGARGTEPVDMNALAGAITSLSHLALDYPELLEIDFNPVFATANGIYIADARLMQKDTTHGTEVA